MKKLLFIALSAIICSCVKKTCIRDITLIPEYEKESFFIYYGDKAYTGTVWSNDGRTVKMEVDGGIVTKVTSFHKNGEKAIYKEFVVFPDSIKHHFLYDDKGNEISDDEFDKEYPLLNQQIEAVSYEFTERVKKQ